MRSVFPVIDPVCKCEVKDDSFPQPLLMSLSHWINALQVRETQTQQVSPIKYDIVLPTMTPSVHAGHNCSHVHRLHAGLYAIF